MDWTDEQEEVFSAMSDDNDHVVIEAVAGSGKTSTIVEAMRRDDDGSMFLAFNREIADELKRRRCRAMTFNGLGHRILKRRNPNMVLGNNTSDIFPELYKKTKSIEPKCGIGRFMTIVRRAFDRIRMSLWTEDDVKDERAEQLVFACPDVAQLLVDEEVAVKRLMFETLKEGLSTRGNVSDVPAIIDFNDQLYIPARALQQGDLKARDFTTPMGTVYIDEAQDLSAIQHFMVQSMSTISRIAAVGDPHQAIYAWRGAKSDSINQLMGIIGGASELSLSRCFRCPTQHVELASRWNPSIKPGRDEKGEVTFVTCVDHMVSELRRSHGTVIVVARTKAKVLEAAKAFLRQREPIFCQGRDIFATILQWLSKRGDDFEPIEDAVMRISSWQAKIIEKLESMGAGEQAESINENLELLRVISQWEGIETISDAVDSIGELVTVMSDSRARIRVMTIHRAKGLEAFNVGIVGYGSLPHGWKDQTLAQRVQEQNLLYVALTRSRMKLVLHVE